MIPEAELLCLCAVNPVPEARRERIRALAQRDLDWKLFTRLAVDHRVFPLAYKALSLAAPEAVPAAEAETLRNLYFSNLARNLSLGKELLRLLEAFQASGLDVVPYKGPVLAESAYGDAGLRQFTDLDILVREGELEQAVFILRGLDYGPPLPDDPSRLKRLVLVLRDFVFMRPNGPGLVELQWRLTQRYHPVFHEGGRVWRRLRKESLAGVTVRTLSWPDSLLVLCLHGLYHSWPILQMVSDVAQTAASASALDWPALVEDARRQGGLRILLLGLLLARDLLGAELAGDVLKAAGRDPFLQGLAARVSSGFFETSSYLTKARSFFFLETRLIDGLGNRARYLWGRLSTPNEEDPQALALPAAFYPLHPVFRLVRLFKKYALKT